MHNGICKYQNCTNTIIVARGYCKKHYINAKKLGEFIPKKIRGNLCSVPGCVEKYKCSGYCSTHYAQICKFGEIREIKRLKRDPNRGCMFPGCVHKHAAKGYCEKHYLRLLRHNSVKDPIRKHNGELCKEFGCTAVAKAKGYCRLHYLKYNSKQRVASLIESKKCIQCAEPVDRSGVICTYCLGINKLARKRRYNYRRSKGNCVYCNSKNNVFISNRSKNKIIVCLNCYLKRTAFKAVGNVKSYKNLLEIFEKQNGKCAYTGTSLIIGANADIDHIVPISRGGKKVIDNVHWIDTRINQMKSNLLEKDFYLLCERVRDHNE